MTAPKKPPISYYGGKQRLAPRLIPLITPHSVYCEPFAGGAAVFFMRPVPEVTNNNHYREVLNDLDGRIINFYRQLRDNGEELTRLLSLTPYSEAEYRKAREICRDGEGYSSLERAWAYYVNISQSFAKKLGAGWGRAIYGTNLADTWESKVATLPAYLNRMKGVHISETDALKCIEQWDSPHTFFFIDPPYVGAHCGHYEGYTDEDLDELIYILDKIQGSFVLTSYGIKGVPKSWERFKFATNASSASGLNGKGTGARTEHVYRKVSRKRVRVELRPVIKRMWAPILEAQQG